MVALFCVSSPTAEVALFHGTDASVQMACLSRRLLFAFAPLGPYVAEASTMSGGSWATNPAPNVYARKPRARASSGQLCASARRSGAHWPATRRRATTRSGANSLKSRRGVASGRQTQAARHYTPLCAARLRARAWHFLAKEGTRRTPAPRMPVLRSLTCKTGANG